MVLLTRAWYRSAEALMEWIEKSPEKPLEQLQSFGIGMNSSPQKETCSISMLLSGRKNQNKNFSSNICAPDHQLCLN